MSATTHLTTAAIRQDVGEILDVDPAEIPLDENLTFHGLDSIRLMTLLNRWRQRHAVTADFTDLAERPAIEAWAVLLGASS